MCTVGIDSPDNESLLQSEIQRLNTEVRKLSRELRTTKSFLDKITRTVEAKDALNLAFTTANQRHKAHIDILLANCPGIIILLDELGRFVISTDELLNILEYPNFDFIKNLTFEEAFKDLFQESAMALFKDAFFTVTSTDKNASFDCPITLKDKSKRFYSIELRKTKTEQSNSEKNILVLMNDVTEIMESKDRAETANDAKTRFLAAMSHEIRTPMNAIIGLSGVLGRANLEPIHQKHVTDIKRSSESLLAILNDILDFSKIEADKMDLIYTDFNLFGLIDNLNSMYKTMCINKHLVFESEISHDLPAAVSGDENRLRQILNNLLSNALKYTQQGKIIFSVYKGTDEKIVFEVSDTGIGIKEDDIERLFKPFEQLDVRKNRNISGTGLGLAITYNMCRMMGGDITVKSEYGKGSSFLAALPFNEAGEGINEEYEQESLFSAPLARVLVVDDMEINLAVAEAMLNAFNIEPVLVESGIEAIKKSQEEEFDLIFMDHMMPGMDGIETTLALRELEGYTLSVPIVALTANVIEGARELFMENRMDDVLPKPLEFNALGFCLRKWLSPILIEEVT